MIDAEDEEADAICGCLAVLAGAACGGVLVGADDVLGTEVARAEAVGAADRCAALRSGRDRGQAFSCRMAFVLDRLRERGADVAAERVVAGQRFVGALEDDDVLLALEGLDDGGLGEGTNHVDVDGADLDAARLRAGSRRRLRCFRRRSPGRRRRYRRRRSCTR